jgi:hypothetical protein
VGRCGWFSTIRHTSTEFMSYRSVQGTAISAILQAESSCSNNKTFPRNSSSV